jgi:hypothetical protein
MGKDREGPLSNNWQAMQCRKYEMRKVIIFDFRYPLVSLLLMFGGNKSIAQPLC